MQFYTLTINEIQRETEAAICLGFDVPDSLKEIFTFKAGQYVTLKATINGKKVRRDYSLCVSPTDNQLKVVVKEVENGTFSTFANRSLKVGDALAVSAPNGRFTFEPDDSKSRHILLFAAGSGITPVMSILKTILKDEPNSHAYLVYGNKSPKDTIFLDELTALSEGFSDRFEHIKLYSQANEDGALFGRIDSSHINYVLKNTFKHIAFDSYYLCGPEAMTITIRNILQDRGVESNKVFYELFTAATPTEESLAQVNDGTTEITVIVDDDEATFTMQQDKTVLEAALNEGLDAPYSCQGGVCSSCIARIVEGEATMRQNNILTDSELAEGLILTCQAQPTSAKLKVDYDDV